MKRSTIIWFLISLGALILVGRITSILTIRQIKSNNLLPNYSNNELVITSALKKYAYNDVVYYKTASMPNIEQSRLLALEHDTVEMKDGYILRNGFLADNPHKIILSYFTKKKITEIAEYSYLTIVSKQINDTTIFSLTYAEYNLVSRKYLLRLYRSELVNFRTTTIPHGYCLVANDNRATPSANSIYKLIHLKNITATLLTLNN